MPARVFLLTKLREGASRDAYEDFVRLVDYPTSRNLPGILSFDVVRLEAPLDPGGSVPYDYIEIADVESAEAYHALLDNPILQEMTEQWSKYVGESVIIIGQVVE